MNALGPFYALTKAEFSSAKSHFGEEKYPLRYVDEIKSLCSPRIMVAVAEKGLRSF